MNEYAVGMDIGGSHACCSVVDLGSMQIVENSIAHRYVDNKACASQVLALWSEAVYESVVRSGVQPKGAGFAFPGPFDYLRGVSQIEGVSKFEHIFGLDAARSLLDRLRGCGIETVKFVNDASAFALGECMGGATKGVKDVVALTLGTGFGSGFVSGCQLITSGERVPDNGWVYCMPFEGGIADDAFTTRWFVKRYREVTGEDISGAKDLVPLAATEARARQVFEEYGERLAQFVAPVCERFGAQAVVLGGNISRAFDLFGTTLTGALARLGCHAQVKVSALHDRAAIVGAASLLL